MRFIEWFKGFFEGDEGRASMTRLLCFISIWPTSYVVVVEKSNEVFGWYVSAYVLGYVGGKATELLGKPKAPAVNVNNVEKVNVNP